MRTKSLLAAAAIIAAGALSAAAQSNVYSLNIVGYVNVGITNGKLALISSPLKPSNGDYNITNTVKLQDPGSDLTTMFKWNKGTASWDPYTWIDTFGWFPDVNVDLGEGFFIQPTLTQTITFVGEVQTGTSTNVISGALSLLANKNPVAGPAPGGAVGHDLDTIFTWDSGANSWIPTTYVDTYGWFDGVSAETNGPSLKVGEGFFYQNTGGTLNWITTLNP
jgi:hypothetical protein